MASTATLAARLETLKAAYHSGVLRTVHNGKEVTFRTRAEMLGTINDLEAEIGAAGSTSTRRTRYAYQKSKGL